MMSFVQTKQFLLIFAGPITVTLFVWIILSPAFLTYFSADSDYIQINNMTHTSLQFDNVGLLQAKNSIFYLEFDRQILVNDFNCLEGEISDSDGKNTLTIKFDRMSQNMPCSVILNGTDFGIESTFITADNIPAINYSYSVIDFLYILSLIGLGLIVPTIVSSTMFGIMFYNMVLEPLGSHTSKSEFGKMLRKHYKLKSNNCDEAILWRIHNGENTIFDLFLTTQLSQRYIQQRIKRMMKNNIILENNPNLKLHKRITLYLDGDDSQYVIGRPYHLFTYQVLSLIKKKISKKVESR